MNTLRQKGWIVPAYNLTANVTGITEKRGRREGRREGRGERGEGRGESGEERGQRRPARECMRVKFIK